MSRSGMVKVAEDLWVNPYAVNAVELSNDQRGSAVHIEAGVRVVVPGVRPNDLVELMREGLAMVVAPDEPSEGFPRPVPASGPHLAFEIRDEADLAEHIARASEIARYAAVTGGGGRVV